MDEEIISEKLKENLRYKEAILKLTKQVGFLNLEEIFYLNLVNQHDVQKINRIQMDRTMNLTEKTIKSSKETAKWTRLLAFATFALAFFTAFLALVTFIKK